MTSRKFGAFSQWSLFAAVLLVHTFPAHAQDLSNGSLASTTAPVIFNFVSTPDVGSISSLSANKETNIWATSVTNSVSLHFNGTSWVRVPMAKASRVNKVAVLSSTNVWAVGQQTNDNFSQIQHFNGTVWSVVSSPQVVVPPSTSGFRTDLLPAPIPVPPPNMGNLQGAGTCDVDPDFGNQVCRVTDNKTINSNTTLVVGAGGSGDTNPFSKDSSKVLLGDVNGSTYVMNLDQTTGKAVPRYGNWRLAGSYNYSYKDDAVLGIPTRGTAFWRYDTSTTTTPIATKVASFTSCLPAGFAPTWVTLGGFSKDEQTFSAGFSNNGGQGSVGAVYVAVIKVGVGCQVLNTATGVITSTGSLPSGTVPNWTTVTDADGFTLHNVKQSKGGSYLTITPTLSSCLSWCTGAVQPMFFWRTGTLNVVKVTNQAGGHFANGFNSWVNAAGAQGNFKIRKFSTPLVTKTVIPVLPVGLVPVYDTHIGWANADQNDSTEFCGTSYTKNVPVPNVAWYNEAFCVNAVTGVTKRLAHTFITTKSQRFNPNQAIGAGSQDGAWFMWSSDWGGTLGSESGQPTCTIGTDCRGDVFITKH